VASSSVHEYWYRYSAVPNPHYLTYFLELLREEIKALKMREAATLRHCSPAQSLSGIARGCTEAQTKPPTS
jgi:hypothetical protein